MTAPARLRDVATLDEAVWMACGPCDLTGGPYLTAAEGELLAGLHDQVRHASHPTARVQLRAGCESCRITPATHTWSHPGAGDPFRLCARCAPADATPLGDGVGGEG